MYTSKWTHSSGHNGIHVLSPRQVALCYTTDGRTVEYQYDPLGRRVAKIVNHALVETNLWSGMTDLLGVYEPSGALRHRFEGRRMIKGGTYYLVTDQVGTVRAVVYSNGNVAKRIDYDAFGNVLYDSAPAFTIPITFAGGLYDPDTKLIHFAFRDYDPETGRWTAKDPIRFLGGNTNLYGYCLDNPVSYRDPLGLAELSEKEAADVKCAISLIASVGYVGTAEELKGREIYKGKITKDNKVTKASGYTLPNAPESIGINPVWLGVGDIPTLAGILAHENIHLRQYHEEWFFERWGMSFPWPKIRTSEKQKVIWFEWEAHEVGYQVEALVRQRKAEKIAISGP